jgi:hypothetical protein
VAAGAHLAAARVHADARPPGAAEAAGFVVAPGRSGGMLVRTELPGARIKLAVRLDAPRADGFAMRGDVDVLHASFAGESALRVDVAGCAPAPERKSFRLNGLI